MKALAGLHLKLTWEMVKIPTLNSPDAVRIQTHDFMDPWG